MQAPLNFGLNECLWLILTIPPPNPGLHQTMLLLILGSTNASGSLPYPNYGLPHTKPPTLGSNLGSELLWYSEFGSSLLGLHQLCSDGSMGVYTVHSQESSKAMFGVWKGGCWEEMEKCNFKCNIQIVWCLIEASIRFFGKSKLKPV